MPRSGRPSDVRSDVMPSAVTCHVPADGPLRRMIVSLVRVRCRTMPTAVSAGLVEPGVSISWPFGPTTLSFGGAVAPVARTIVPGTPLPTLNDVLVTVLLIGRSPSGPAPSALAAPAGLAITDL